VCVPGGTAGPEGSKVHRCTATLGAWDHSVSDEIIQLLKQIQIHATKVALAKMACDLPYYARLFRQHQYADCPLPLKEIHIDEIKRIGMQWRLFVRALKRALPS
jgi:hypothetical protein